MTQIGDAVIDWMATKPALSSRLYTSMVEALKGSWSFKRTDQVWARLHSATNLGASEVAGLLAAVRDNNQVYGASGGIEGGDTGPYSELAFKLAMNQPGFEANLDLAREVARMRGLDALLAAATTPAASNFPWGSDTPF